MTTDRLARAVHLTAAPLGNGAWGVSGGAARHVVTGESCDCADHAMHGGPCKHQLAVALEALDADVRAVLRQIVALPTRRRARTRTKTTAGRSQRGRTARRTV